MDIWRLKGMRGNTDQEICPVCMNEEGGMCDVKEQGTGRTDG
jgi:hypothetical protein